VCISTKSSCLKKTIYKSTTQTLNTTMTQLPTDLNNIDGWLEFSSSKFVFSKKEEYLNEEGHWEEREDTEFTSEELAGPICISQRNKPTLNIEGIVKFKDGTIFYEPECKWNLSNFFTMVKGYEMVRRRKPENYFLDDFDYQHVLWAGMVKVDDYYVINWD